MHDIATNPKALKILEINSVLETNQQLVEALASNGMDEIEIPAFLRKQAD